MIPPPVFVVGLSVVCCRQRCLASTETDINKRAARLCDRSVPGLGHERRRCRHDRLPGQHPARRDRQLSAAQVLGHAEERRYNEGVRQVIFRDSSSSLPPTRFFSFSRVGLPISSVTSRCVFRVCRLFRKPSNVVAKSSVLCKNRVLKSSVLCKNRVLKSSVLCIACLYCYDFQCICRDDRGC